jgi:hypothetical protein
LFTAQGDFLFLPGEVLLFFQPRWGVHSRGFQFDMKLFKCLFKLLLIPSKVGSDGIVEKDQLIVQHFNLWAEQGKRPGINSTDSELDSDFLHPCFSLLTQTPRTALWGHGTSDDF